MNTACAISTTTLDQICRFIQVDDVSTKAANWFHILPMSGTRMVVRVPAEDSEDSKGVESRLAAWPSKPKEWAEAMHTVFVPRTELAKKLWALRQKYIAEGGKLYSVVEIQQEVARCRGEVE